MNTIRRIWVTALVIGALLLSCGIVSAEAPAKGTLKKVTFIHYKDDNGNVKEKVVTSAAKPSTVRDKTKPAVTPTPAVTVTPTETVTSTPGTMLTPTPTGTATPAPTETIAPTPTATATPTPSPTSSDLYKLRGYHWTQFPVQYYIKPDVPGLSPSSVINEVVAAFNTWDSAVSIPLCEYAGTTDAVMGLNERNEIQWVDFGDTRIIGQTAVWYKGDVIVETDIKMNTRMGWGIDADGEGTENTLTGLYDVQNIATHEAGHGFGLADLYDTSATDMTMYGYSRTGEVKRISLGYGDILGIQALYGA